VASTVLADRYRLGTLETFKFLELFDPPTRNRRSRMNAIRHEKMDTSSSTIV